MKLYQLIEELEKLPVEDQLKHVKFYDRKDTVTLIPHCGVYIDNISTPDYVYIYILE